MASSAKIAKKTVIEDSNETSVKKEKKQGLTFKEKREFEQLSAEIQNLESEKKLIESELSTGELNNEVLIIRAKRHGDIIKLLDDKELRWLELSEL